MICPNNNKTDACSRFKKNYNVLNRSYGVSDDICLSSAAGVIASWKSFSSAMEKDVNRLFRVSLLRNKYVK